MQKAIFFSAIAAIALLVSFSVEATTRHGAVYKSGQVVLSGGNAGFPRPAQENGCDEDEDLLFTFTESASPSGLGLDASTQESGAIQVTVTIDASCGSGSAVFEYAHELESGDGVIGEDISISPEGTGIEVALEPGNTGEATFNYQALEQAPFNEENRFVLFGDQISFFVGEAFGQASQRRDLAIVTVASGDVVDIGGLPDPGDSRTVRAAQALNEACELAPPGSTLAETCLQIDQFAETPAQRRQAAEAFDAHQITSLPSASSEGARIQGANVAERMQAIRDGAATGMSLDGLSFNAGGYSFDVGWLPTSLLGNVDSSGGGGNDEDSRLLSDRWGVFVNGTFSLGDRSRRGNEIAFDFDSWGLTAGTDYRFDNGAVAGLAAGYSSYSADFTQDTGSLDGDTWSLQAFGTFDLRENLYVDATLGYSETDFDIDRVVDLSGIGNLTRSVAQGSTDARQVSASLSLNYRIQLDNAWTITPYGEFNYADTRIDAYSESGSPFAYRIPSQSYDSQLFSAGARVYRPISMERGVLMPFVDLAWDYENGLDSHSLQPVLVESGLDGPAVGISDPDRNFGRIDTGFSWVFPTGNQLFLNYSGLLFDSHTTRHSVFFGFRWEL